MDPEAYRADSAEKWEQVAGAWRDSHDVMYEATLPVGRWLVDHIEPQPGHTVLELAAGPGDTGLLAAELIQPGGKLISTDRAEPMVEAARARAEELGITNAEFRTMDAEWIDLSAASVDGVLCRWGYMLLADPEASLRETRRVLRPGGRVALAAWDAPDVNPWITVIKSVLERAGHLEPFAPDEPGPHAFAEPGRIEGLLDATGFEDVLVDAVDFTFTGPSIDAWWEHTVSMSPATKAAVAALSPAEHYAVRDAVDAGLAPYLQADGGLVLPARTLVAAASA